MSKKNKIDEVARRYEENESLFSGGGEIEDEVLDALTDTGSYTEKLSIFEIWPDLKQPRRAIPSIVRGRWNGDPDEVEDILVYWREMALKQIEDEDALDEKSIIMIGEKSPEYDETEYPLLATYVELVRLAQAIYRDGLINPITVTPEGGLFRIHTGERRWLAHHLLNMYVIDSSYKKIAAREKPYNVWAQATENTARSDLNAISMARQLALLIMDMWSDEDGVQFDSYESLVLDGDCDLPFYAQVADGNIYRIKRGMSEKIQNAMNFASRAQVSQYRALLRIDYEIWLRADAENWSEHRIREYVRPEPKKSDTLTGVNIPSTNVEGKTVKTEFQIGDKAKDGMGRVLTILSISGDSVRVMYPDNKPGTVHLAMLKPYTPPQSPDWMADDYIPPSGLGRQGQRSVRPGQLSTYLDKRVQMNDGRFGQVRSIKGGGLVVHLDDGAEPLVSPSAFTIVSPSVAPPDYSGEGSEGDDYEGDEDYSDETTPENSFSTDSIPDRPLAEEWGADSVLYTLEQLSLFLEHSHSQKTLAILQSQTGRDVLNGSNGGQEVLIELLNLYSETISDLLNQTQQYVDDFLRRWESLDNELRGNDE